MHGPMNTKFPWYNHNHCTVFSCEATCHVNTFWSVPSPLCVHKLIRGYVAKNTTVCLLLLLLLLLPLALQPTVGFGLSNNVLPFFLYATNSLHLFTPITWRSLSTSSFHLFLGLPLLLVPSSSWVKIFLGILSSSILSRWPNQLILCPFIHFTTFSPLLISSSSRFVRLSIPRLTVCLIRCYILNNQKLHVSASSGHHHQVYFQILMFWEKNLMTATAGRNV